MNKYTALVHKQRRGRERQGNQSLVLYIYKISQVLNLRLRKFEVFTNGFHVFDICLGDGKYGNLRNPRRNLTSSSVHIHT
jgi:hypothetical protein